MTTSNEKIKEECCPPFNIEKWDGKTLVWDQKPFIKASVPTMFHIPFSKKLGKKITKLMHQAEYQDSLEKDKTNTLLLFTDPHPFRSDMYLSVSGRVPKANNVNLSGAYISKVFDGPYRAIPTFMKEMDRQLKLEHKKAKKYYVHYAYCPKCAKERGHNYMVLFAALN